MNGKSMTFITNSDRQLAFQGEIVKMTTMKKFLLALLIVMILNWSVGCLWNSKNDFGITPQEFKVLYNKQLEPSAQLVGQSNYNHLQITNIILSDDGVYTFTLKQAENYRLGGSCKNGKLNTIGIMCLFGDADVSTPTFLKWTREETSSM